MKLINCDLGECLTPDPDGVIMPLIDMANIACGGHAGDDASMIKTIKLARKHGVSIGVHPSYPDIKYFGRISQPYSQTELFQLVIGQITYFRDLCQQQDVCIKHIKPHGALYHDMMHKTEVLEVLCSVIHEVNPSMSLVVQAGVRSDLFECFSKEKGIEFLYEAFADRGYRDLQMIPRGEHGAILEDANEIIAQYQYFSIEHSQTIDTICLHSDNPASVLALQMLKEK